MGACSATGGRVGATTAGRSSGGVALVELRRSDDLALATMSGSGLRIVGGGGTGSWRMGSDASICPTCPRLIKLTESTLPFYVGRKRQLTAGSSAT